MTAWGYAAIGMIVAVLVLVPRFVGDIRRSMRRRRAFDGVPISTVASSTTSVGRAQWLGTLSLRGEPARAPIRARDAAFVRMAVEVSTHPGRAEPERMIDAEERWGAASLTDPTGEIALDTGDARFELDADRHVPRQFTTNLVGPPPAELAEWMERRRVLELEGVTHVTVSEWIVDDGDPVAVIGTLRDGDGPYRGKPVLHVERVRLLLGSKF